MIIIINSHRKFFVGKLLLLSQLMHKHTSRWKNRKRICNFLQINDTCGYQIIRKNTNVLRQKCLFVTIYGFLFRWSWINLYNTLLFNILHCLKDDQFVQCYSNIVCPLHTYPNHIVSHNLWYLLHSNKEKIRCWRGYWKSDWNCF